MPTRATSTTARAVRTFLIGDIRGYTAFTARHGDEAASKLASRFANIAGEAVAAWSGRLVEVRGDEVLCVFDGPCDALRCAVELQDAFLDERALEPSLPLRVGLGVATGDAVPVGDGYRGSALNLAARLCSASATGEIHASVATIERLDSCPGLRFEEVTGLTLKGFAGEQHAFRVRSSETSTRRASRQPRSDRRSAGDLPSDVDVSDPLVGREAEMRWLGWHWRRAWHGHHRTVVISGPPGVGKTRLAAELARSALEEGASVRYTAVPPAPATGSGPDGGTDPATLVILDDGAGASWPRPSGRPCHALGSTLLTVVVRTDPGPEPNRPAGGGSPSPSLHRLELQPFDLEGIRALAVGLSPDTADEVPIARVLEASEGMPHRAREAVLEWAARIEAERTVGSEIGSMPAERSSFIGRVDELQDARRLLEHCRLLTLTGPPGTGKTRLAVRLARDVSEEYTGGTYFVALASIGDVGLVGSAVARSMQLRESVEASALDVVKSYLSERQALLVLDNFEHLAAAAPQIGALLDAAPGLKVVVTSRAALALSGEQVYPVPPLAVPPTTGAIDIETVAACDATALFVMRARASDPGFDLRPDNAQTVVRITARLEGLPLAIELAAARVRALGLDELLEHLQRRLPFLTGGSTESADRHRTMRDAIAWSYELLADGEQALLRHLSVFRGGFTLEAAARVASLPDLEMVDGIDALLGKSLLLRTDDRVRARYSMLELVREFSADELSERGEAVRAAERHAAVYLDLGRELEPVLDGKAPGDGAERLSPEVDNLRTALAHASSGGDVETSLELAACIWRFWQSMGQLSEGRDWLERALALPGGTTEARAKATAALGGLAYWQGDFDVSRESYRRARDLFSASADRTAEADAVYSLSLVASLEGDLDLAERYADEAMDMARALGDEAKVGEVLMAQTTVAWSRGDLPRAAGLFNAALDISERTGMRALAASQLVGVAGIAFQQGDTDLALRKVAEALRLSIEIGNTHTQIFALDSIASFAASQAPTRAVCLCSAAASLRAAHGGGWTLESFGVKCAKEAAAHELRPEEVEHAWHEGTSLDLEAATRMAQSLLEEAGLDPSA